MPPSSSPRTFHLKDLTHTFHMSGSAISSMVLRNKRIPIKMSSKALALTPGRIYARIKSPNAFSDDGDAVRILRGLKIVFDLCNEVGEWGSCGRLDDACSAL